MQKGDVGIGKSSFFTWWMKKCNPIKYSSKININTYDKKNEPSFTNYMYSKIYKYLHPLLLDPKINSVFTEKVKQLARSNTKLHIH